MHWSLDCNFYITSRQLVDIAVIRLKNPHKHMLPAQAQTRTQCFCSCLSLRLLPVRDGNFQLGDTANVIIQWQEYWHSIQTHFFCLPASLIVYIFLLSLKPFTHRIRGPWSWKCFSNQCNNASSLLFFPHFPLSMCFGQLRCIPACRSQPRLQPVHKRLPTSFPPPIMCCIWGGR